MEPLKEQADEVPDSLEFHPITNPEVSQTSLHLSRKAECPFEPGFRELYDC